MYLPLQRLSLALASAALLSLAACSGDSATVASTSTTTPTPVAPAAVTKISGVVADGLIKGASACYDLNDNGVCDSGEPTSSETGADGGYLLSVPAAEAGKHNVIVSVPATAIDSDNPTKPVGTAFTMRAPPQTDATKPVFVSPVTTIVTDVMAASGTKDPAAAIASVQSQLGMTLSPLDNFVDKGINGTPAEQADAKRVATIAQVVTQLNQQIANTAVAANVPAADAKTLISIVVLNNLSNVVNQVDNKGTTTVADLATSVLTSQGLGTTTIAAQSAAAKQVAASTFEFASATPKPFSNLRDFRYTDSKNYFVRIFEGDDVADADGFKYQSEVRQSFSNGVETPNNGTNQSYWSPDKGAWVECRLSGWKISKYKQQTATTDGSSSYCEGAYKDTSKRTVRDISGSNISSIVAEFRAYPFKDGVTSYSNWGITPTLIVGSPTFPAGSEMHYGVNTQIGNVETFSTTQKIKRDLGNGPASSPFAAALRDVIGTYGGDFPGGRGVNSTVLNGGNGAFTLGASEVDDPSVTNPTLKPRKRFVVALQSSTDTTGNARFYVCGVLASNNNPTGCVRNMDTTYTITAQGDARVLRFAGYPTGLEAAAGGRYMLVERAGAVFNGFLNIPLTSYTLRLNKQAWEALRAVIPVVAHTPASQPPVADASSWLRDMRRGPSYATGGAYSIRWIDFIGSTSGTTNEIRLNADTSGNTVTFARNALFWNGTRWVESDGTDKACPSNGVGFSTWNSNPRVSTGCGITTEAASGFDVDISGKSVTATLADMRQFGSYGYGLDYSTYGPIIDSSDPRATSLTVATFPKGSRLRYQVNTTVQDGGFFSTNNPVKFAGNSVTTLSSLTAVFTGGYSGTVTTANAVQLFSFATVDAPAAGTSGVVRIFVSFQPTGAAAGNARFFDCDSDSITNGLVNCQSFFDTTYAIAPLGGKNQLKFAAQFPRLIEITGNDKSFIESFSVVYQVNTQVVGSKAYTLRLNQPAYETIFNILGITKPATTPVAP